MTLVRFLICAVLLCVMSTCSVAASCSSEQEKLFQQHKTKHGRLYKNSAEEQRKKKTYCERFSFVQSHNANKKSPFTLEMNHLAEMTQAELNTWNAAVPTKPTIVAARSKRTVYLSKPVPPVTWPVPASLNWTAKGVTPVVRDQGSCGSCYAFAAAAALEALSNIMWKSTTPYTTILSVEHILDCTSSGTAYRNNYCNGGMDTKAYKYVIDKGLEIEKGYPYTSHDVAVTSQNVPACKPPAFPSIMSMGNGLRGSLGYQWVLNPWPTNSIDSFNVFGLNNAGNVDLLKGYVAKQPVSAYMWGSMLDFALYKKGIKPYQELQSLKAIFAEGVYSNPKCPKLDVNHLVLIVGYGHDTATGLDYWLIKNSWSAKWGDGGYAKIQRGVNMCGIERYASIPTRSAPPRNQLSVGQALNTKASGIDCIENAESLTVNQGDYMACLQGDGNFVVSRGGINRPTAVWATWTEGKGQPPYQLAMQGDNNLVLYDSLNAVIWTTGTGSKGQKQAYLEMRPDGSLKLYDRVFTVLWTSGVPK